MIKGIKIEVDGKILELNMVKARELYSDLSLLFGNEKDYFKSNVDPRTTDAGHFSITNFDKG